MPPEPPIDLAAASASMSVVVSSIDSGSTGADDPPGQNTLTLRPSGGPPASSMITCRNVAPSSTSYTPGRFTLPLTVSNRVPGDFSVPSFAYAAPPLLMIHGTVARVSMLLSSVGRPQAPLTAGNGGRDRGCARLPSSDSSSAVSSPQMYAPWPR